METEGIEWLERIRDGSIFEYLKEVEEIERIELPELPRKILYEVIDSNKKGKFPKRKYLAREVPSLSTHIKYLKKSELIFDASIIEFLYVFGIYERRQPTLPPQLNYATENELEGMRGYLGRRRTWKKKMENPRASRYPLFYIALISENGRPVFAKAFSFLEIYNSFVAPQTGQTHISLEEFL